MAEWCKEHYILTFLLASSALSIIYAGVSNIGK